MMNMTTMNSVYGVLNQATNRDFQVPFQQRLYETIYPILGDSDAALLESFIRQLPMLVGRTEQESLDLYADSLRTLLEKQTAFKGTIAAETAAYWMQSLRYQALNGQITPQEVETGVNNTLAHQSQFWFDKLLKDAVGSSLPTDFINEFRLGIQSPQVQLIAALDANALKAATAEISASVNTLAQKMSSSEVRDSTISFLRNAFRNQVSVDINKLKNSNYLLTQESFRAAVSTLLVTSIGSIGITLSSDDAKSLSDKIAWIPSMSKQKLSGELDALAKQVKGQYENAYRTGQVNQLQNVFNTVVTNLKNSPDVITLSSLFSSIGDRFDDRVLSALDKRRVNRLGKRNAQQKALENRSIRLKMFSVVQSKIHSVLSANGSYMPGDTPFSMGDFTAAEQKYLRDNHIRNHKDFLTHEGVSIPRKGYKDTEKSKSLSNLSSAVSAKSKSLNDEVQIKITELNDTNSQYNSTVEAMNKFVQKYHNILQEILRAM